MVLRTSIFTLRFHRALTELSGLAGPTTQKHVSEAHLHQHHHHHHHCNDHHHRQSPTKKTNK